MSTSGEAIARWAGFLLAGIMAGSIMLICWKRRRTSGRKPFSPQGDSGHIDQAESRWRGYLQACLRAYDADIPLPDDLGNAVRIASECFQLQGRRHIGDETQLLIHQANDLIHSKGLEDRADAGISRLVERIGLLDDEWRQKFVQSFEAMSGTGIGSEAVLGAAETAGIITLAAQTAAGAEIEGRSWCSSCWTHFTEASVAAGALVVLDEMKRRMMSDSNKAQAIVDLQIMVDEGKPDKN